jgi:hypothetical protein
MTLTYRTVGAWGAGKGTNLLPSEIDQNIYELATAIADLQDDTAAGANGIATITIAGSQMSIFLTDGTELGPFTIPVLTFRWRGEWEGNTSYAELDVVKVTDVGIFMVQVATTSNATFDATETSGDNLVYFQLFGSVDALLSTLGDVSITTLLSGDILHWNSSNGAWENIAPGDMAFQNSTDVNIIGGVITGMPVPVDPTDVATKAYVDSLPDGASAADKTVLANITGAVAAAIPVDLSDVLDYVLGTTARGATMFRGSTGWQALGPGTAGQFLKTMGAGADVMWDVGGSGVTSVDTGTGLTGGPITATGTIAFEAVSDSRILANIAGSDAEPIPNTLSAILDHIASSARGTVLTRTSLGWVALAPGAAGTFLKAGGAGADLSWDTPTGSGTVTSVTAGAGLTAGGSPITTTGTIALATIADHRLFANISGGVAVPSANTLTAILDNILGTTQGAVVYRNATVWTILSPGTTGQVLTTGGAAANVSWADVPASPSIPNNRVLANVSGSPATPSATTITNLLDALIGSTRGTVIFRSNSGWGGLAAGTSGFYLKTAGTSGDPSWASNQGDKLSIASPAAQDTLYYNSSSGKFENVRPKYIVSAFAPGLGTASQKVLFHPFSKAVTLPANLGAYLGHTSKAVGSATATGSTVFTLSKALAGTPTSFSNVATITFSAGSVTGSMSVQAAITFAQGDILKITGPSSPDATFSDFALTLVGFET